MCQVHNRPLTTFRMNTYEKQGEGGGQLLLTRNPKKDSEQSRLPAGEFAPKVFVSEGGGDSATGGAVDHADLHQVRLLHLFDGVFFFGGRSSEPAEAVRAPRVLFGAGGHPSLGPFLEAPRRPSPPL